MRWIAVITLLNCDPQYPLLCCSFCQDKEVTYEQITEYQDKANCNAFAHEWAQGKTIITGHLYGGRCEWK